MKQRFFGRVERRFRRAEGFQNRAFPNAERASRDTNPRTSLTGNDTGGHSAERLEVAPPDFAIQHPAGRRDRTENLICALLENETPFPAGYSGSWNGGISGVQALRMRRLFPGGAPRVRRVRLRAATTGAVSITPIISASWRMFSMVRLGSVIRRVDSRPSAMPGSWIHAPCGSAFPRSTSRRGLPLPAADCPARRASRSAPHT